MLAVVKIPNTDLSIQGDYIPEDLLDDLRSKYGASTVIIKNQKDSEEYINITDTDWYKEISRSTTPGTMLKLCRTDAHWTQKQLAERLGIDKHIISELERGVRPISIKMARALGKIFGHSYKNFLPDD